MGDRDKTTIFAVIDRKRKKALFHQLIDDGMLYKDWLCQQIDAYTKPKPKPKGLARFMGKEA